MNWGECYLNHYSRLFGEAVRQSVFSQDNRTPAIQILEYDRVFPSCRVFASFGASNYVEDLQSVGEVILPADDGWANIPFILADSLFQMIRNGTQLGWGVAVGGIVNIDPEFVHAHDKDALYITSIYGLPKGSGIVSCGKEKGYVYLAFFISAREYDYFSHYGAESFEHLLESNGADPFDVGRASST